LQFWDEIAGLARTLIMRGLAALLVLPLLSGCLGSGSGAATPPALRFPGPRPTRLPTDASVYLQRIRVGYGAYDIAAGDGGLWVAVTHGLTRIDPQRGVVSGHVRLANEMEWTNVATDGATVWYLHGLPGGAAVTRFDARSPSVRRTWLFPWPAGSAFEDVAATRLGACVRELATHPEIDCVAAGSGRRSRLRTSRGVTPHIAATAGGEIAVGGQAVRLFDPATGAVRTLVRLRHGMSASLVAGDGARIWAIVTRPHAWAELWGIAGGTVVRRVTLPVEHAVSMAARDGRVWLLTGDAVYAVRPDGVMARIATVPRRSRGLVATPTALWTAEYLSGTVIEISAR
jgi:hypothetical protein